MLRVRQTHFTNISWRFFFLKCGQLRRDASIRRKLSCLRFRSVENHADRSTKLVLISMRRVWKHFVIVCSISRWKELKGKVSHHVNYARNTALTKWSSLNKFVDKESTESRSKNDTDWRIKISCSTWAFGSQISDTVGTCWKEKIWLITQTCKVIKATKFFKHQSKLHLFTTLHLKHI